jgi:hypothetical protein
VPEFSPPSSTFKTLNIRQTCSTVNAIRHLRPLICLDHNFDINYYNIKKQDISSITAEEMKFMQRTAGYTK